MCGHLCIRNGFFSVQRCTLVIYRILVMTERSTRLQIVFSTCEVFPNTSKKHVVAWNEFDSVLVCFFSEDRHPYPFCNRFMYHRLRDCQRLLSASKFPRSSGNSAGWGHSPVAHEQCLTMATMQRQPTTLGADNMRASFPRWLRKCPWSAEGATTKARTR